RSPGPRRARPSCPCSATIGHGAEGDSVQEVGGVEEHLVHALTVLALEPRHPVALPRDVTRTLAAALEIAAAGTPPPSQVLVHLAEGRHRDRQGRRGTGARGGEPAQAGRKSVV